MVAPYSAFTNVEGYDPLSLLIKEIAEKNALNYTLLNNDQMIRLEREGRIQFIQRYTLPINSSSAVAVCRDKAATSDLLKSSKIAHIRHRLFLNPILGDWTPKGGSWPFIHQYAAKHQYNVVCKPKDGSRGIGVSHTTCGRELEQAIHDIFATNKDVVICPFKPIKHEYRVLVYDNNVELILRKKLPKIVGDGEHHIAQLITSYLSYLNPNHKQELIKLIPPDLLLCTDIPPAGKDILLHWEFNSPGATTEILGGKSYYKVLNNEDRDQSDPLLVKLYDIALKTTKEIGIRFASVDIAELWEDSKQKLFRVLEVNSSTMIDSSMDVNPNLSREIELTIYTKIIKDLFLPRKHQEFKVSNCQVSIPSVSGEQKVHGVAGIVRHIASANCWSCQSFSQGWISRLAYEKKVQLVYGYTFPLNNSMSTNICNNKVTTSDLLKEKNVPQIRHHLITLSNSKKPDEPNAWSQVRTLAEKYNYDIVCKPVVGTGGIGVEHVTTKQALENAVSKMLGKEGLVALSGYKKILYEYRVIMLDNEAEVIFKKVPPYIVGDGIKSVRELTIMLLSEMQPARKKKLLDSISPDILASNAIPNKDEQVYLHWKHNLGQGATCELLGGKSLKEERAESDKLKKLIEIAQSAMQALTVRFASVDIVEVEGEQNPNKLFRVMEVNAGIMMDNLMEQHGLMGVNLATRIYSKALGLAFSEE